MKTSFVNQNLCQMPIVTVDVEEVERRTGMTSGCDVAEINVVNAEGLTAKFFLEVRINKQGRAEAMLTAMKNNTETHRKTVADWRL